MNKNRIEKLEAVAKTMQPEEEHHDLKLIVRGGEDTSYYVDGVEVEETTYLKYSAKCTGDDIRVNIKWVDVEAKNKNGLS